MPPPVYQPVKDVVSNFPAIESEVLDMVETLQIVRRSKRIMQPEQRERMVQVARRGTDYLV